MPQSFTDSQSNTTKQSKNQFSDSKKFLAEKFEKKHLADEIVNRMDRKIKGKIPKDLDDLRITIEPVLINGRTMCRLNIDFVQNNDPNFAGAKLWIKGYGTDNTLGRTDDTTGTLAREETLPFQLVASISRSPAPVILEASSEDIIVGVEAINSDGVGSGLKTMKTQTLTLI